LRGPSFHVDLLKEYADLDLALDPFPFTGGLTSCEALWMGVPVITWPRQRVVSRQTFALLNQIGLPELAARDGEDYVRLAVALANDPARRAALRAGLRERMRGLAPRLCHRPALHPRLLPRMRPQLARLGRPAARRRTAP
jgi:protein O-GlcNAc transferase